MFKRKLVLPILIVEDKKPDWLYENDRTTYKVIDSSSEDCNKLVICICPIREEAELIVQLLNKELNK